MSRLTTNLRVLALFAVLTASSPLAATAQDAPLYERLGGQSAIEAVVDQVLSNVGADTRINQFFANADMGRTRTMLLELICQATGGPCTYTGRSMAEAHRGLGITDAHFGALVEDLTAAMDTHGVPDNLKTEFLGIFGAMKSDIVEGQAPAPSAPGASPPHPTRRPAAVCSWRAPKTTPKTRRSPGAE